MPKLGAADPRTRTSNGGSSVGRRPADTIAMQDLIRNVPSTVYLLGGFVSVLALGLFKLNVMLQGALS
jgi:hypothetical protein